MTQLHQKAMGADGGGGGGGGGGGEGGGFYPCPDTQSWH